MVDRLTATSATLFFTANIFATASLVFPEWIVSDVGGSTKLGLLWSCFTIYGREQTCHKTNLQPEWMVALVCIVMGHMCIMVTVSFLLLSHWYPEVVCWARWAGFSAMMLFCLAACVLPMGFTMDEIGGVAFQLPSSHQVGLSYIFFVLALWITIVSELFAGKVCMPHF